MRGVRVKLFFAGYVPGQATGEGHPPPLQFMSIKAAVGEGLSVPYWVYVIRAVGDGADSAFAVLSCHRRFASSTFVIPFYYVMVMVGPPSVCYFYSLEALGEK